MPHLDFSLVSLLQILMQLRFHFGLINHVLKYLHLQNCLLCLQRVWAFKGPPVRELLYLKPVCRVGWHLESLHPFNGYRHDEMTKDLNLNSNSTDYCTVNLEIFARVLFSRNFAYAKFRENKILEK